MVCGQSLLNLFGAIWAAEALLRAAEPPAENQADDPAGV